MEETSQNKDLSCSVECNKEYLKCINKGEHESVCNMERAHCDCSCYK